MAVVWLAAAASLLADTNAGSPEEIPPLRPPRAEIPLTFWEKHGHWIVGGSVALVALAGVAGWLLSRPKPEDVVPPEIRARRELEQLRARAEDGALLSRVSQVLRCYVAAAFDLPPGELTTAEFCRVVAGEARIGPELAGAFSDFLRRCDERKFTPPAPRPELGAVGEALKLIAAAEARRAELRAAASESAKSA